MIDFNPIKRKLESLRCKEHHEKPNVSYSNSKLSVKCCCDNFRKTIIKKAEPLIADEAKKSIEKSLGNMFK